MHRLGRYVAALINLRPHPASPAKASPPRAISCEVPPSFVSAVECAFCCGRVAVGSRSIFAQAASVLSVLLPTVDSRASLFHRKSGWVEIQQENIDGGHCVDLSSTCRLFSFLPVVPLMWGTANNSTNTKRASYLLLHRSLALRPTGLRRPAAVR